MSRVVSLGRRALLWLAVFAALCWLVRGYPVRDPDSMLYEWIARTLQDRPLREWIAPHFPLGWPSQQGLFFEHFACLFWPAAALGRLGLRGALAANFLWMLLSYALLFRLARSWSGDAAAWAVVFFYAISPIGLQYLVRANQEPPLACAYLGALWCVAQKRPRPIALAGFLLLAVAIKGALGLAIFPVVLSSSRRRQDLYGLALGVATVASFCVFYELWFEHVAGTGFFRQYFERQMVAVVGEERRGFINKLATPLYYLGCVSWFGLPGLGIVLFESIRRRKAQVASALTPLAVCVAVFSLLSRRAVRYIFPAYALCNLAGAQVAIDGAPRLREFIGRNERVLGPALAAFLIAGTAVRVAFGGHVP